MNSNRAEQFAQNLAGKQVGGWTVGGPIGHGKSAVILRADRGGNSGALKVFDPELIDEFGREIQLERVRRELDLRGETHPNLVSVLDGGSCDETGHVFVVTALLDGWENLASCLDRVPDDNVQRIVEHVASAARFLEDRGFVHRDIKPANIVLDGDFSTAVLLDLGVIRPLDASTITSDESFVGTLQYSSPEFLFGEEEGTVDGGRALTFYQLGAVLHDLLIREPLFGKINPYARKVEAVKSRVPRIEYERDPWLAQLARNCLVKDPRQRLALVSWSDFELRNRQRLSSAKDRRARVRARMLERAAEERSLRPHQDRTLSRLIDDVRAGLQNACVSNQDIAPCAFDPRPGAGFVLTLERSRPHCLPLPVRAEFRFELVGAGEEAVRVQCSAALTAASDFPKDIPASIVFEGAIDTATIVRDIEDYVYELIEEVLDLPHGDLLPDSSTILGQIDERGGDT